MVKNLGRLISYGERTARSYNFPEHIIYKIWTNTGSLDMIFCKKTEQIIPSKDFLNIDYKDLNGSLESMSKPRSSPALETYYI
jgi:hypothetical protein